MSVKRIYNVLIKRLPESKLKYLNIRKQNTAELPASVDLRSKCAPVYDQGELGSCTANALGAAYEFDNNNSFQPSRLFIYYNERKLEDTVKEDSGALISDGIKTLQKFGVCPETMWPYDIKRFKKSPSNKCYKNALLHRAIACNNIQQNLNDMKNSLASGFPFVVGIAVYSSFESEDSAKTGVVPMPDVKNEKLLGGHAVMCVGYNDEKSVWIMRNSWGASWGQDGYFTLPYDYLLDSDLSSELWNITAITDKNKSLFSYTSERDENDVNQLLTKIDILSDKVENLTDMLEKLLTDK